MNIRGKSMGRKKKCRVINNDYESFVSKKNTNQTKSGVHLI